MLVSHFTTTTAMHYIPTELQNVCHEYLHREDREIRLVVLLLIMTSCGQFIRFKTEERETVFGFWAHHPSYPLCDCLVV